MIMTTLITRTTTAPEADDGDNEDDDNDDDENDDDDNDDDDCIGK